ncbi:MAG: biotin/lipoyl-binding protein [Bacteroidetes bacterium]|nr:biotin/lipoyl-binding protein [Bacteroidota bacterium]
MKQFSFIINGNEYEVNINSVEDNTAEVEVNGTTYSVETVQQPEPETPTFAATAPATNSATTSAPAPSGGGGNAIKSPLPGIILNIFVSEGQQVKVGDQLCCLEAMKMENIINADQNGTIKAIHIAKGKTVMEGDVMFEMA